MPSISIIVRTMGQPERLAEALASLTAQTRSDLEVVVVDMSRGANDRVLDDFSQRLTVRRVTLASGTRPKALNAGIAIASAPVIGILDDDNLYDPKQLDLFLDGLATTGADYVYTGVRHVTYDANGARIASREVSRDFVFDDVILGNYIYATGSAFRKSLWERLGGYDERFEVFEDWDFIIRAAQSGHVAHLGVVAGESRKFTGIDGVSNFDLGIALVRKCQAGIYWKHRRLYFARRHRSAFRMTFADHCARRRPARTGLLARNVRGWRLELFADLFAWWVA
jgi:glycosyltransferase involved in cell wall biosynthesis